MITTEPGWEATGEKTGNAVILARVYKIILAAGERKRKAAAQQAREEAGQPVDKSQEATQTAEGK